MVKRGYALVEATGKGKAYVQVKKAKPSQRIAIPKALRGTFRKSGFYGRYNQPGGKGGEVKFLDTANSFTCDTTGEVPATGQLNLIPQGVTESTRVGRKATVKSIQIRGTMTYVPATDTFGTAAAFIYLVLDKQANGAAAAITDVLTTNVMTSAMINMANSERFVILKKWRIPFVSGAGVSAAYGRVIKNWEFYKKCNIPLEFSSTTGAITELKSNNIFFLAGADGNADDEINVSATTRIRFSDD